MTILFIHMKSNRKQSIYIASGLIATLLWLAAISIVYSGAQKIRNTANTNINHLLKESILLTVQERAKHTFISGITQHPEQIGTMTTRIFRTPDTTFTYKCEVVDAATKIFQVQQLGLLLTDSLKSDHVKQIFDSVLRSRQIQARTAILIEASGYFKKAPLYSGDTLSINTDVRANYTMNDGVEQIKYTAYVDYSLFSLWRLTSKHPIYIAILLTALLIGMLMWHRLKSNSKKRGEEEIIIKTNCDINQLKEQLDIQEECILYQGNEIVLPHQSFDILKFILHTEAYRVNKKALKEQFWPPKSTAVSNMTSAIKRLNNSLKQLNYPFNIITDPEDKSYYILNVRVD